MKQVRLGFIGLGYIVTSSHLPSLTGLIESKEVVLKAFCDLNEETLQARAAEYGVEATYTSYEEMLDREELDAVYVCLPPTLHTDQVPMVAGKGLHVFVEKPPSLVMAQAVEHGAAIEAAGIVSQVGFQSRYYPSSEHTRKLLGQRTNRHASVQRFYGGASLRYWTSRFELCGGSFVENTIHTVDLLRYFLGDIERASAFYLYRQPGEGPEPINNPHVYDVNYRFASGVVANVTTSRVLTNVKGVSRMDVVVVSDDSMVEWSAESVMENGETVWTDDEGEKPTVLQARSFVAAALSGDPQAVRSPYLDSLNSLAAVLGANISAERDGEAIDLKDVVSGAVRWNPESAG